MAVVMRKLTISVSEDFYLALLRTAGARKMGTFIEANLKKLVASDTNLAAGYQAMAQDKERETEAKEWLQISGQTMRNADATW